MKAKPPNEKPKVLFCACGNRAVRTYCTEPICDRCRELERRLHMDNKGAQPKPEVQRI